MSQQIETHILSKYKIIKKIGSGAYGHVYKVSDRKTKKIKALKKNFDAFNNSTDAQRTYRQIMFLMELKHPNIINLQEVIPAENGKDIYLVFQHMDADLHILVREGILAEKHKKYIMYQTAKAILYLHSAGLIHRDLKPSNILVNQSCEAKLCDFGLVRSIDDGSGLSGGKNNNQRDQDKFDVLTEYIATRWYRAPEILLASKIYSKGIDIWGYGCLAAEMMKGKPLFPGTSTINQLQRVLSWTGPPTQSDIQSLQTNCAKQILQVVTRVKKLQKKQFFQDIDPKCLDLISRCLQFNPSKRITIQQIVTHPYLQQFYEAEQIVKSQKKVKVPIDDNRRLSLRDYRALIYEQIKKRNKNAQTFNIPFMQAIPQDSAMYRIRQKPKKTIRTQQSEYPVRQKPYNQKQKNAQKPVQKISEKEKQTIIKQFLPKKSSLITTYENQSRTVNIKKQSQSFKDRDSVKKKTFYKAQSVPNKNLKTISNSNGGMGGTNQEQDKGVGKLQDWHQKQRIKKQKELIEARKTALFKQSNTANANNNSGNSKQWNKVKRSVTEGDSKRDKFMTHYYGMDSSTANYNRK